MVDDKDFVPLFEEAASVVIRDVAPGGPLSATEVLATWNWFRIRAEQPPETTAQDSS